MQYGTLTQKDPKRDPTVENDPYYRNGLICPKPTSTC